MLLMPSLRNLAFYVLLALFIGALSAGITLLITDDGSNSPGIEILVPTVTASPVLKVYVSGGVQIPGVYTLKRGDRVEDAIQAAGGAVEGAQLSCVNLAVRVTDEAHFHVPDAGEPCESPTAVVVGRQVGPEHGHGARAADVAGHRRGQGPGDSRLPGEQRRLRLSRGYYAGHGDRLRHPSLSQRG